MRVVVIYVILLWIAGSIPGICQTGFFIALDKKDFCVQKVIALDGKSEFCVTNEPIISAKDFKVEGGIKYTDLTQQTEYFNLRFTDKGFESLQLICEHFPEKQLLLIVKGKVVGDYESKKLKLVQVMPISGKAHSKELRWVYDNLKSKD